MYEIYISALCRALNLLILHTFRNLVCCLRRPYKGRMRDVSQGRFTVLASLSRKVLRAGRPDGGRTPDGFRVRRRLLPAMAGEVPGSLEPHPRSGGRSAGWTRSKSLGVSFHRSGPAPSRSHCEGAGRSENGTRRAGARPWSRPASGEMNLSHKNLESCGILSYLASGFIKYIQRCELLSSYRKAARPPCSGSPLHFPFGKKPLRLTQFSCISNIS